VARGDEAADVEAEAEGGDAGGEEAAVRVRDDAEHRGGDGSVLAEEAEAVAHLDHEEHVGVAGLEVDHLLLQRGVALAAGGGGSRFQGARRRRRRVERLQEPAADGVMGRRRGGIGPFGGGGFGGEGEGARALGWGEGGDGGDGRMRRGGFRVRGRGRWRRRVGGGGRGPGLRGEEAGKHLLLGLTHGVAASAWSVGAGNVGRAGAGCGGNSNERVFEGFRI